MAYTNTINPRTVAAFSKPSHFGAARIWTAVKKDFFFSGSFDFATFEEALNYIREQFNRTGYAVAYGEHKHGSAPIFRDTFIINRETFETWTLADLGIAFERSNSWRSTRNVCLTSAQHVARVDRIKTYLEKRKARTTPHFHKEFPDYPIADMPAIPAGFDDVSWHNDSCPSFLNETLGLIIFADYADMSNREIQDDDLPRFTVNVWDNGNTGETVFEHNDFQSVSLFIDGWQEETKKKLASEYVATIGYDPFEDDASATIESVKQTLVEYKAEGDAETRAIEYCEDLEKRMGDARRAAQTDNDYTPIANVLESLIVSLPKEITLEMVTENQDLARIVLAANTLYMRVSHSTMNALKSR